MSVPTAIPERPVPTRSGRSQCPACRCFLSPQLPAACPRCRQPLNTDSPAPRQATTQPQPEPQQSRPEPPQPREPRERGWQGAPVDRRRLAGYEAEIAYRISRDIRSRWPDCSIARVWPSDIALIVDKTFDYLVVLEREEATA